MKRTFTATFDQLVVETGWLRRLAVSLLEDQAAADDMVHDTVLVAAAQPPADSRPLRPWLARVLLNRVRMHGRSTARRRRREQAVADLAAAPATPEAIVDRLELQRKLAGLVLELARPLRDVLLLHYFEGLSSAAIGNHLGLSDSTVRWRLKQARDDLRDRLEDRSPSRAWVAPLAGFAGVGRSTAAAGSHTLLVATLAGLLALLVVAVLAWRALPERGMSVPATRRADAFATVAPLALERIEASDSAALLPGGAVPPAAADQKRITGAVVDSAGRPVEDAVVRFNCMYRDELTTGGTTVRSAVDGRFTFEVDPDCSLSLEAEKGAALSERIHDMPRPDRIRKPAAPFVLRMAPMPIALFKIVDAQTGAPLPGARLSADAFRNQRPSAVADAQVSRGCRSSLALGSSRRRRSPPTRPAIRR